MHPDPIDRRHPRLTATLIAAAGLAVGVPLAVAGAAAVEFTAQARKALGSDRTLAGRNRE